MYNKLQTTTGRWGYVHQPETSGEGGLITSVSPPIPRILWRRGMSKDRVRCWAEPAHTS